MAATLHGPARRALVELRSKPWAYGGIAQFAAGTWEFAKGNVFGAAAFTSYGAFWLSFWWLNAAVLTVFVLLTLTFLMLACGDLASSDGIHKLGGYLGLLTALAAWYSSLPGATALTHKKQVLPACAR